MSTTEPTRGSASELTRQLAGTIPLDRDGNPAVTNEMKAECLGEFTWKEAWPYYDEDGVLHENHVHTHVVPWSVCKEIYKRMASEAMKGS